MFSARCVPPLGSVALFQVGFCVCCLYLSVQREQMSQKPGELPLALNAHFFYPHASLPLYFSTPALLYFQTNHRNAEQLANW
jgi:hypothetical protein